MQSTAATLTARHELANARYAVLRFERGPETRQRASWYTRGVTEQTLASQIRQLAAERHYDRLDNAGKIAARNEIAELLGATRQAVYKALKQTGQRGRRKEHAERCPLCEHAIVSHSMRDAIDRNLPKLTKLKKR